MFDLIYGTDSDTFYEIPTGCKCLNYEAPDWKTSEKSKMTRALYSGMEAGFAREIAGVEGADNLKSIFQEDWIEYLFSAPRVVTTSVPRVLFVAADPSGGGNGSYDNKNGSETAYYGFYMEPDGKLVTVFIDSFVCQSPLEEEQVLGDSCKRALKMFPKCVLVFIPESNFGFSSTTMYHRLKEKIPNMVVIDDEDGPRIGVKTTHARKREYTVLLSSLLRNAQIAIHKNFFTSSTNVKNPQEMLDKFKQELTAFRFTPAGKLSGKMEGCDDIVITLGMGSYHSQKFIRTEAYKDIIGNNAAYNKQIEIFNKNPKNDYKHISDAFSRVGIFAKDTLK